ncbi:winged helix-turn-helix transcriptional regulator [Aquimarina algiphila]|uniref:winged helix-turn-helix transcriptional regulator n=1 Tax=Aquimarina algiphila TaxID=2047982 RepID=UPI0023310446|nr:helix-turn-helix domain-containing protein [Aquimarina algiphila]
MKESKSLCPVNQYLEVFGDKWTLLIIRDIMFDGKRYFNEIRDSDEKIASNILTDRLNKLEKSGVILKTRDIKHKQKNIYTLTKTGIDLMPIIIAMSEWSLNHRKVSDKDRIYVSNLIKGGKALQNKMSAALLEEFESISKN